MFKIYHARAHFPAKERTPMLGRTQPSWAVRRVERIFIKVRESKVNPIEKASTAFEISF